MSSVSTSLLKSINSTEVSRTFRLLEMERISKTNTLRRIEKVERDLSAYTYSVKEKDSKITELNKRLKTREKEWYTELD